MQKLTLNPLTFTFGIFSEREDVLVFITTRQGGTSQNHLSSCNIGFNSEESSATTIDNRKKICDALSIDFSKLTFQHQVHDDRITIVDLGNAGAGLLQKQGALYQSDAMITTEKGVTLFAQAADCVPIAIFDPKRRVIAAIHAGWRGTVKKIAQKTALKMIAEFGCTPQNMLVGIGPSIGRCCYEVGKEVVEAITQNFTNSSNIVYQNTTSYHIDLWEANKSQLTEIGISDFNIEVANECTKCNSNLYYSSRNDNGFTGRFGIGISML